MSETSGTHEPKPQDPELLACQVEMKKLCDEILALKPERIQLTYWDVAAQADPLEVQQRLRESAFGDLMLQDGDTLSAPTTSEHHPDLNLFVGQAQLWGVTVRAWSWEYDKHRINPNGPDKPPYDIIKYPGEKDWTKQLDVSLHYTNGKQTASQTVTIQTGSMHAGQLPSASRDVSASAYAETGYEGHNQTWRACKDEEEVMQFISLAKELFDTRSTDTAD